MLKNYFKSAYRQLINNRQNTFINIIGLAIGFAICLVIAGYVIHEYSYEDSYKNKDRIVRAETYMKYGASNFVLATATSPFGPAVKDNFPEVEDYVRFMHVTNPKFKINNTTFEEKKILFCDANFPKFFNMEFLYGDPNTALANPFSIVIDELTAKKYFGTENALGKRILYAGRTQDYTYNVTGVMKNMPSNTVIRTPMIASFSTQGHVAFINRTEWRVFDYCMTFLQLKEGARMPDLEAKITDLGRKNIGAQGEGMKYFLKPIKDIYFNSVSNDLVYTANKDRLTVFSITAGLILLLAAINYVNLNTAKISSRLKETAVRKTVGADRASLTLQFLTESSLVIFISMAIGVILFYLLKPALEKYIEQDLMIGIISNPYVPLTIGALLLFVILFSGTYPAVILSRYKATSLLRPNSGMGSQKTILRKVLVTLQYTITIGIIIYVLIISRQTGYMENMDLGFNKNGMIVFNQMDTNKIGYFREELKKISGIKSITQVGVFPSEGNRSIMQGSTEGDQNKKMIQVIDTDSEFIKTFGVTLLQGRNFRPMYAADENSIIVNETFVKSANLSSPIGVKIISDANKVYEIIGVMKDFHSNTLKEVIYPLALRYGELTNKYLNSFAVRPYDNMRAGVVQSISKLWKDNNGTPFEYKLSQEVINAAYEKDNALVSMLAVFCISIIIIGCLGVLGLTSFMAERKTKEIGIRKVLGASIGHIIALLSKDLIIWIAIANVFAWPLAYWIVNDWLAEFPYHITLGIYDFIIPGVLAMAVALLTAAIYTIKSAVASPVQSLRSE